MTLSYGNYCDQEELPSLLYHPLKLRTWCGVINITYCTYCCDQNKSTATYICCDRPKRLYSYGSIVEPMLQSTPTLLSTQSTIACLPSRHDRRLHDHRVTSGQAEAAAERRLKELGVQLDEAISERGQIEQEARSSSEVAAEQLREVQVGSGREPQALVLLVLGLAI